MHIIKELELNHKLAEAAKVIETLRVKNEYLTKKNVSMEKEIQRSNLAHSESIYEHEKCKKRV